MWSEYKVMKAEHKNLLEAARIEYNNKQISKSANKTKTAWKIIKYESAYTNECPLLEIKLKGEKVTDLAVIADLFRDRFQMSAHQQTGDMSPVAVSCCRTIFLSPVTEKEVHDIIMDISPKFSPGVDCIPPFLMRLSVHRITGVLTEILNAMVLQGQFPNKLKIARTVPVHKGGSRTEIENYRPIAVLSCFSKIFERVIYKRFYDFLDRNSIMAQTQYGFLPNMSCERALYDAQTSILSSMEDKFQVAAVFFDLSKAFDHINHHILLKKLYACGIRGVALGLMESYLVDRSAVVEVSSAGKRLRSAPLEMKTGVPQGSILGPLLFLIYMNDLHLSLNMGKLIQYADDTTLVLASKSLTELSHVITVAVQAMERWCVANDMLLNCDKTNVIHFSLNTTSASLLVWNHGRSMPLGNETKFLGVYFSSSCGYSVHVEYVLGKVGRFCYSVYRLRAAIDLDTLRTYYLSCCQPILAYGIILWGSSPHMDVLFRAQKRILRNMLKLGYRDSCRPHFKLQRILTLPSLYIYHALVFCRKNIHLFKLNSDFSVYNTRNSSRLSVPAHNLAAYERGANYMMIQLYNTMPRELHDMPSMSSFKKGLRVFLVEQAFYSTREYLALNN